MAENRGKPSGKAPGKAPDKDSSTETGSGRVGKDDRGNMTWEWADDGDLQADDTLGAAERIRALVDPTLNVEDDDLGGNNPVKSNPKGLTKGYNPYNSGALGKAAWKNPPEPSAGQSTSHPETATSRRWRRPGITGAKSCWRAAHSAKRTRR